MTDRVRIRRLPSGVPGFDEVLGGGIPELSLNLIAGGPGCGKTTLAHQIMFANATADRPALFITIVGEPPIKMMRYQQQFSFFDASKVDDSIRFLHLAEEAQTGDLDQVLQRIISEVDRTNPALVFVDSFRGPLRRSAAARAGEGGAGELEFQEFVQRLALHLTSCEATTFLLGEYDEREADNAVFTVADGIVRLTQAIERNSVVRKMNVQKMRGQGQMPGLQTMRITDDGVRVFPRHLTPKIAPDDSANDLRRESRLATGVPAIDEMLGGGVPRGYWTLVAGPSGSGKTVLSTQFILEGARAGELGLVAAFEKRPSEYLRSAPHSAELRRFVDEKKVEILDLRPLDLSIDETMTALHDAVVRLGAKRVLIDSLSGLELALAPSFREDYRESLYRMVGGLTAMGVTVFSTVELRDSFIALDLSPQGTAFLADVIILQRYVPVEGQLRRAIAVVKVRGSQHSKDLREYEIDGESGLIVGEPFKDYAGVLTGAPVRVE